MASADYAKIADELRKLAEQIHAMAGYDEPTRRVVMPRIRQRAEGLVDLGVYIRLGDL